MNRLSVDKTPGRLFRGTKFDHSICHSSILKISKICYETVSLWIDFGINKTICCINFAQIWKYIWFARLFTYTWWWVLNIPSKIIITHKFYCHSFELYISRSNGILSLDFYENMHNNCNNCTFLFCKFCLFWTPAFESYQQYLRIYSTYYYTYFQHILRRPHIDISLFCLKFYFI